MLRRYLALRVFLNNIDPSDMTQPFSSRLRAGCIGIILVSMAAAGPARAQRTVHSLNGTWDVAQSVEANAQPERYDHTAPVPGLVKLAQPAFENVGVFYSRELLHNMWARRSSKAVRNVDTTGLSKRAGVSGQKRNYFWYRRSFDAPAERERAVLRLAKAKYGAAVWCNGKRVATRRGKRLHLGPFSPAYFDLTGAVRWNGNNELVVRVGAHPGVLPMSVLAGTDQEKYRWIPGLYDDVEVRFFDRPAITHVQVAPRLDSSLAVVQTTLANGSAETVSFTLAQQAQTWKGGQDAGAPAQRTLTLPAGADTTLTQRLRIPDAHLWSPEDPFLYVVHTTARPPGGGGDSQTTRFGMRSFHFRPGARRASLNGRPYFLRGSNVTLHRFFEDPDVDAKPWDPDWVRGFLGDLADRMHWNAFRFSIGPVPELWLRIADEEGLLIQNEFMVWRYHDQWKTDQVIRQYKDWMQANWNHPSVAIWDASNETHAPILRKKVIPAVRPLDLSHRPWDDGYTLPAAAADPVEDHPYDLSTHDLVWNGSGARPPYPDFTGQTGAKSTNSPHPTGHAAINNEYAWLWLHRDGTPTVLTQRMWAYQGGGTLTPKERLELQAYLIAGETEYWRAHRNFAGVLHFTALTSDRPDAFTADNFADLDALKLHPSFADYVGNAFKPLGVFINRNLWVPANHEGGPAAPPMEAGEHEVAVVLTNDGGAPQAGTLTLALHREGGGVLARTRHAFALPARGQMTYRLTLDVPASAAGRATLKATATSQRGEAATVSRRWVRLSEEE